MLRYVAFCPIHENYNTSTFNTLSQGNFCNSYPTPNINPRIIYRQHLLYCIFNCCSFLFLFANNYQLKIAMNLQTKPIQIHNYLLNLLEPAVDTIEGPLAGDVIDKQDALSPPRVRPDDGAEATLTGRIPYLQLYSFAIQQNCCCLVC